MPPTPTVDAPVAGQPDRDPAPAHLLFLDEITRCRRFRYAPCKEPGRTSGSAGAVASPSVASNRRIGVGVCVAVPLLR